MKSDGRPKIGFIAQGVDLLAADAADAARVAADSASGEDEDMEES